MIGIFDSGAGGLTVAKAIETRLPKHQIVYLGDIARNPYGPKSKATIQKYSVENTEFLLSKGAELIVIACNSASSVAAEYLRSTFDVPIIEVVSPAVATAVKATKTGRIGMIGTKATVQSGAYDQLLSKYDPELKLFASASPLLVPLIEEGWLNKRETKMILKHYLRPIKDKQVDTLILGCTHYPLLKKLIGPRVGKKVALIDSSDATAEHLQSYLKEKGVPYEKDDHTIEQNQFYFTDITATAQTITDKIFGRKIQLQLTNI